MGYQTRKGEGRGRIIERVDSEAEVVQTIHKLFDSGMGVREIRRYLIHGELEQKGDRARKHEWQIPLIYKMLKAEDYTGIATWNFQDGTNISIEIPVIVPRDLWERNQARIERNKERSTRNAKGVYLLYGIIRCGDCGQRVYTRRPGRTTKKHGDAYTYFCSIDEEEQPDVLAQLSVGLKRIRSDHSQVEVKKRKLSYYTSLVNLVGACL